MKKQTINIKIDRVKQVKQMSRELFSGVKLGSKSFKDKSNYTRKQKHKQPLF
jgi:hypothetical protein